MKKLYAILVFLFSFNVVGMAQAKFEKMVFIHNGEEIPYNILKPQGYKFQKDSVYPLVVFLHGAGERGTDNEKNILHIKELFLNTKNQKNYPAFIIAPQCPVEKKWVEVPWSAKDHRMPAKPSWAMQKTTLIIDEAIEDYPIDTNRIYVTGLSMGGYGTWDLISRFPDRFAAAVPICGGGDTVQAPNIKDIPLWDFHGSNDKVVPVSRSRNMIKALKKAGGNPKYTEYKGVGHLSWGKAYREEELLPWLFMQKKTD